MGTYDVDLWTALGIYGDRLVPREDDGLSPWMVRGRTRQHGLQARRGCRQ